MSLVLHYIHNLHSLMRYWVLLAGLATIAVCLMGWLGNATKTKMHKTPALLLMIGCDIQLLLGLIQLFANGHLQALANGGMKNTYSRFYGLEHPLMMLIGISLAHVAYTLIRKGSGGSAMFRKAFIYAVVATALIAGMTPWPGRKGVGAPLLPAGYNAPHAAPAPVAINR
ncbi:MAG: hypothetical protein EBX41_01550 [Chitinophagia bacterium]|nr:hypothetical protein [Chitinophagia bacterium]